MASTAPPPAAPPTSFSPPAVARFSTGIYWCKRTIGGYFPAQTVTFTGNPLTGGGQLIINLYNFTASVPATAFMPPPNCNQPPPPPVGARA